jgi:hypothetical protein
MVKLYSPENESELALIKSLFEPEHINYYVLNDHFGTMKVGPKIDLLNVKTIYVSEEDLDFAKDILLDFLENTKNRNKPFKSPYSMPDKVRMVIETLVFNWFIPGNRWNRNKKEENV